MHTETKHKQAMHSMQHPHYRHAADDGAAVWLYVLMYAMVNTFANVFAGISGQQAEIDLMKAELAQLEK